MTDEIINKMHMAVLRAKALHNFPKDVVHQAAILAEESGEVVQAALDYHYHDGSPSRIIEECYDTIAVCIRIIENRPL